MPYEKSQINVSRQTVELYRLIPQDRWVTTTELSDSVELTRRGILHALDKLADNGVIEKKAGSPGIARKVRRLQNNKTVKSHRAISRSEPAGFHMVNGYEVSSCSLEQSDSIGIHRLVAVAEYGIDAVAGAHVHHINSIPWDNRPSNLTPLSDSEHRRRESLRRLIENVDDTALAKALEVKNYSNAAKAVREAAGGVEPPG